METFLAQLRDPAFKHVLINHLPITGLAAGALALLIAVFMRSRRAQIAALSTVLAMSACVFPTYVTGEDAYRQIRRIADDAGADWLDAHLDRADRAVGAFYALAGLSLAALAIPLRWPRTGTPLAALTLLGAIACVALGGWIADAGGLVRHPELRPAPQTPAILETP